MNGLDPRFESLRRRFLDRSVEDLKVIETALADLDKVDGEELRRTVHRLAGAAGTFGFGELSRIAGEADDALMVNEADVTRELERLATALRSALA